MKVTTIIKLTTIFISGASSLRTTKSTNSIRKSNRKLSDIFAVSVGGATTATIDRYYKEPKTRDVPFSNTSSGTGYSSNSCVLNGAGIYGSSTSTSSLNEMIPLLFEYELELASEEGLVSEIIPDLEQAIGMDLAMDVNVCSSRRMEEIVVGTMQGVGLLPVDQVNANKTCTSSDGSTSCVYVNGIMTLYYIPASSDNIIRDGNEIEQSSLNIIQSNMDSGKYNSGAVNPNIVRVTYASGDKGGSTGELPISNVEETPTNPEKAPPVGRDSDSSKAYGYVIIASCAVLAVVAIIFVRRKSIIHQNNSSSLSSSNSHELRSIDKDVNITNDNDQTTITTVTKDVPPDLEISVTDTTDVSTMGSPSSTDDSSISTLGISMGCPSNESMEMDEHVDNAVNTKRTVPAPLLGGLQDDEKSYQDDELLFNK